MVIDNSIPARPQSGLSQASIVYELPTEAMITRLLALFCDGAPEVVGPVRSLRTYMLEIAREYNAVVAHVGGSESALAAVEQGAGPVINQISQSKPFWRDLHRRMPYNVYTSVPALRGYIRRKSAPPAAHWQTVDVASATSPMTIRVPYGRGYDVQFVYDPATSRYRRLVDQRPVIDAATGKPLTVASIIIQYARWSQTYESGVLTSRLDLLGEGQILAFTAGQRFDGRWRRPASHQPTIFMDQEGRALQLQAGPVWVCIVPPDHPVQESSQ